MDYVFVHTDTQMHTHIICPRVGSGAERIDALRFLAGYRTR